MVTRSGIDLDGLVQPGRVHGSVYTDAAIFQMEIDRIFSQAWVYVAHESEIAHGGDYKSTYIGQQPVIVTRNADDDQVYVLFNRCRHRAATVCQQECGNANYFRCAYHGWTYNNRGELVGVTYRQGYGPEFNYGEMGLMRVPRVASYRGFIFASLAPEGESLHTWLGDAKRHLDRVIAQSPTDTIEVRSGAQKYGVDANWKLQMENSADNYHVTFVHQSAFDIMFRKLAASGVSKEALYAAGPRRLQEARVRDLGHGHTINDREVPNNVVDQMRQNDMCRGQIEKLERELGRERADEEINRRVGVPFTFNIFPNLVILGSILRVLQPVAVNRTEMNVYTIQLKDVPDEINALRLRDHELQFGPAGFVGPDDAEILTRVQEGLKAKGNEWVIQMRELGREEVDQWGNIAGNIIGETGSRGIFRQWKAMMGKAMVGSA